MLLALSHRKQIIERTSIEIERDRMNDDVDRVIGGSGATAELIRTAFRDVRDYSPRTDGDHPDPVLQSLSVSRQFAS